MQVKRQFILNIIFIFFVNTLFAQTPYFQQEVNYKIQVKLDDVHNTLDANETIVYKNNSPDALKELWFQIWPNAYSDRNTALSKQKLESGNTKLYFATEEEKGFIDSLNFKVDAQVVSWEFHPQWKDVCKLILNEPLKPNTSISITTPFHVKIPSAQFSRLGHTGQAYYITQWYPKPAVYDNKGWHPMPFLNQGEFYSEFGSFEVNITLPKNYVVGATGDLNDENEVQWLNDKADETKKTISFPTDMSFPKSDTEFKTLTYKQSNVHDFAWFADKRFHVLKGEVITPHQHNVVTTWTMFTNNEPAIWMKSIEYMNDAIYHYSLWNGDYPYKQCTAIDGTIAAGGGMEYPNVTIIGECRNDFILEDVIVHEVGHNWFYGMLGSNEREHGWMDEGINSFNEMRYVMTKYPPEKYGNKNIFNSISSFGKLMGMDKLNFKNTQNLEYSLTANINADQPIDIAAADFMELNYGTIMYSKTALAFNYLKSYLGDSVFDQCMQNYFSEWQFKHPYPEDVRKVFETTAGKKLDWFFTDLIQSNKKIDYAICNEKKSGDDYVLTLANRGDIVSPVIVSAMKGDSILNSKWIEGFDKQQQITMTCHSCDHFQIDANQVMPEIKTQNNSIRNHGLFKKVEPLSIHLIGHFDYPHRTRLNFAPVVGWNEYNKWMPGLALYNKFLPEKKLEYIFVPMFGIGDKEMAGIGNISYSVFPNQGLLDRLTLSAGVKRFAFYNASYPDAAFNIQKAPLHYLRINSELKFYFRKSTPRSAVRSQMTLSSVTINEQAVEYTHLIKINDSTNRYYGTLNRVDRTTYRAAYQFKNSRILDPFSFSLNAEGNRNYLKFMFSADYMISYPKSKRGVNFHFFTGGFGFDNTQSAYPFYLSNWSGLEDAWYDDLYFGRTETTHLLSKQMVFHDGGFKVDVPYAKSNKFMAAFNVEADLPHIPISIFADIGSFDGAKSLISDITNGEVNNSLLFDGGICLDVSILKIYVPLLRSADIRSYQGGQQGIKKISIGEQIRFELDLSQLNPFNLRKKLYN